MPEEINVRKLPLNLILSNYSEQAKDLLASEDEYSGHDVKKAAFSSTCSFLHTLKNSLYFDKHEVGVSHGDGTLRSLSSRDSLYDAVSQLSSTSSARDEESSKPSSGMMQEVMEMSEEQEQTLDYSAAIEEYQSTSGIKEEPQESFTRAKVVSKSPKAFVQKPPVNSGIRVFCRSRCQI